MLSDNFMNAFITNTSSKFQDRVDHKKEVIESSKMAKDKQTCSVLKVVYVILFNGFQVNMMFMFSSLLEL